MDGYALVVDDHPLVARGFAEYLQTHCGFASSHIATDSQDCLQRIAVCGCPALVVVDFWLPDGSALSLLQQLTAACVQVRLLVVSGDEMPGIQTRVREAGAHGFLRKNDTPEMFARAVSTLLGGELWFPHDDALTAHTLRRELPLRAADLGLTERQGEVLTMMLRGLPNKRIAQALSVSEPTVKEHVSGILARLGVTTRVEAIALLDGRRLAP